MEIEKLNNQSNLYKEYKYNKNLNNQNDIILTFYI